MKLINDGLQWMMRVWGGCRREWFDGDFTPKKGPDTMSYRDEVVLVVGGLVSWGLPWGRRGSKGSLSITNALGKPPAKALSASGLLVDLVFDR